MIIDDEDRFFISLIGLAKKNFVRRYSLSYVHFTKNIILMRFKELKNSIQKKI